MRSSRKVELDVGFIECTNEACRVLNKIIPANPARLFEFFSFK